MLRLQPYNYKVCCVKSQDNIADALSGLTKIPASEKYRYDDEHVRMVALSVVPIALKIQEIESASAEDQDLQAVRSCLIRGNWAGRKLQSHMCGYVTNLPILAKSSCVELES